MRLLIINTNKDYVGTLKEWLETMGNQIDVAYDQTSAEALFKENKHEMLYIGHEPGSIDSIELLQKFRTINPELKVIISAPKADLEFASLAIHKRAYDFFPSKIDFREILVIIEEIEQKTKIENERKEQLAKLAIAYARLKQAYDDLQAKAQ
ncbi:MAG: hypothetical protein HQM08_17665 [Candidatus Riflebacteria bacterium]|nr:hypothetical protein [Candidatus Riflebacteria bacterium]